MKQFIQDMIKAFILGFILPALLLWLAWVLGRNVNATVQPPTQPTQSQVSTVPSTAPPATAPSTAPAKPSLPPQTTAPTQQPTLPAPTQSTAPPEPQVVQIPVMMDGKVKEMDLEEYLLGVMLAEVPASFHRETLKAQAIASRTYTLKCTSGSGNHKKGYICTSSGCCQAYISPESYIISGGKWKNIETMRKVLEETAGQVITYERELILSTYFSCSGGSTESAMAVFGVDYPYLQAVSSPGEESAYVFSHSRSFSAQELREKLDMDLPDLPETWFGPMTYTQGGGVDTITIGGAVYRGSKIQSLLRLRSTAFSVQVEGDTVTFHTLGYGHRVGMSQFGAEAMAKAGKTFDHILLHYYTGTRIEQFVP